MRVSVLAFARVRELLGFSQRSLDLPENARALDVWNVLVAEVPSLADLFGSTRLACNATIVDDAHVLCADDEVALLPPAGGG